MRAGHLTRSLIKVFIVILRLYIGTFTVKQKVQTDFYI